MRNAQAASATKMNKAFLHSVTALLLICMLWNGSACAQEGNSPVNRDLETWTGIGLKYKHNKHFKLELQEQVRMDSLSVRLDQFFTQFEGTYSYNKNWSLGVGLRYMTHKDYEWDGLYYDNHFRYHFDLKFRFEAANIEFTRRLRFQKRNELGKTELQGDYPIRYWRYKHSVEPKIKNWKFDPKFSYEFFFRNQIGSFNGFTKFRLSLSTTWKITKQHHLNMAIIREKETRLWNPKATYIVAVRYNYYLKRKKKGS